MGNNRDKMTTIPYPFAFKQESRQEDLQGGECEMTSPVS